MQTGSTGRLPEIAYLAVALLTVAAFVRHDVRCHRHTAVIQHCTCQPASTVLLLLWRHHTNPHDTHLTQPEAHCNMYCCSTSITWLICSPSPPLSDAMSFATDTLRSSSTALASRPSPVTLAAAPPSVIAAVSSGSVLIHDTACLRCAWVSPVVAVCVSAVEPTRGTSACDQQGKGRKRGVSDMYCALFGGVSTACQA
jgi:hypothetical protein